MELALLSVPYDSGHRDRCMGAGPARLLEGGLRERLVEAGHRVSAETLELPDPGGRPSDRPPTETTATFGLARRLAERVRAACEAGRFPVVLSGNCSCCLGVLAGLSAAGARRPGTVWLDAHGDFNTPETTRSGFLDGMALATATGRCWRELAAGIPGFRPLAEERVVHLGGRDFDAGEAPLLDGSGVTVVPAAALAREAGAEAHPEAPGATDGGPLDPGLRGALDALAQRADAVYVHLDVDVLDPRLVPSNPFAPAGGLAPDGLRGLLATVRRRLPVRALAVASYDPAVDPEEIAPDAIPRLVEALLSEPEPESRTREETP